MTKSHAGGAGPGTEVTSRRVSPLADGNDEFALALYGALPRSQRNVFLSPFSIRTVLGMAYAGARGETAAEMGEALRLGSPVETPHEAFAEFIRQIGDEAAGLYALDVANSLWVQEGAPLRPEFLDVVARHYGGRTGQVDFRRNADAARRMINRWVEERTKDKIRELIPFGGLDTATGLVLANAVYFKGAWEVPFSKVATLDVPFYLEGGGTVRTPLMRQQDYMRWAQAEGYQAAELAYRGGVFSMIVLLPDRKNGLRDLESRLSLPMLRDCVAKMRVREIDLSLPKFKMTWGTSDVSGSLGALGMPLAFTRQADFSGINGHEPPGGDSLSISAVFHQAFVDVNEEGTEAAAATAMTAILGMAKEPEAVPIFRADHPFLFAIRHRKTGAILFLGRMGDPTRDR